MKSRLFGRVLTTTGLVAAAGLAVPANADSFRVIAKAGDSVLVGGQQMVYARFMNSTSTPPPVTAASGSVGVLAMVRPPNSQTLSQAALYFSPQGTLQASTRASLAAPGLSGVSFSGFNSPIISAGGDVLVVGNLAGASVVSGRNSRGYWRLRPTGIDLAVREGSSYGSISLGTVSNVSAFEAAVLGDSEGAAFKSNLVNPTSFVTTGSAQIRTTLGATDQVEATVLARSGQVAPGTSASFIDPLMVQGPGAFSVIYGVISGGDAIPGTNDKGLWKANAIGGLSLLARTYAGGTGVPGTSFPTLYATGKLPQINRAGHVAFQASLVNSAGQFAGTGIWSDRSGSLQPLILSGASGPDGTTLGSLAGSFTFRSLFLSGDGTITFVAPLQGSGVNTANDRAIFVLPPSGQHELVARGGSGLPCLPHGVTLVNSSIGGGIIVNDRGDLVFRCMLQGTGVSYDNDSAVIQSFVQADGSRSLRLLAREGQPLAGTSMVFRDVSSVSMHWLNNRGQFVFVAPCSLGTAAPTSTLVGFDELGQTHCIYAVGTRLLCDPEVGVTGFEVDPKSAFNDQGELVATVQMSDARTGFGGEALAAFRIVASPQATPSFTAQPVPVEVRTGEDARFSVSVSIPNGASYHWRRNGTDLSSSSRLVGTASSTLLISQAQLADAGNYTCRVSYPDGTELESRAVPLTVRCRADYDRSGVVEQGDLFAFIGDFLGSGFDYNEDGRRSNEDLFAFLTDYLSPCN